MYMPPNTSTLTHRITDSCSANRVVMTVAAPPVAPVHENGLNGVPHGHHVNMSLPRFHPIAMNPTQIAHHEHMMQNHHHFRPFQPPPMQEPGPPGPPPHHSGGIDHIEARLRQLEHEEAARMAARSHLLAVRKREDEDYRRMTENAEAEEEVCYQALPYAHRNHLLTGECVLARTCAGSGNA